MSLRDELRTLLIDAVLSAGTMAGLRVYGPRDWPTQDGTYPNVLVQAPRSHKASKQRGMPEFDTTVTVVVTGRVQGNSPATVQAEAEQFADELEVAVLTYIPLVEVVQQFVSVDTDIRLSAEGEYHMAEVELSFDIESFEFFDAADGPDRLDPKTHLPDASPTEPLQQVDIHLDAKRPFDPSGTYTTSTFPAAVTPAPRQSGPDGRDEGGITLTNLDQ